MRVGIIAEGKTDQAVIENILRSVFGIDSESIQHIRPSDGADETDLHQQKPDQFGNCALVKKDCLERFKIQDFFSSPVDEGERLLVIHVDTDEIGRTDAILTAVRPTKDSKPTAPKNSKKKASKIDAGPPGSSSPPYADTLRNNVIAEIDGWLEGEFKPFLRYAIAIEETEAWVLALHIKDDRGELRSPKKALDDFLHRPNGLSKQERKRLTFDLDAYGRADELSKGFRREKTLRDAARRNRSLHLFVESLKPEQSD